MAENVQSGFVKRLGRKLMQRLGIRVAPATKPKTVQAVVMHPESMTVASPGAKAVVRVVSGQKDIWIKKL
jgi:hypothetical protein